MLRRARSTIRKGSPNQSGWARRQSTESQLLRSPSAFPGHLHLRRNESARKNGERVDDRASPAASPPKRRIGERCVVPNHHLRRGGKTMQRPIDLNDGSSPAASPPKKGIDGRWVVTNRRLRRGRGPMQRPVVLERLLKSTCFPKEIHRFQVAAPAAAAPGLFSSSRRSRKTIWAMATNLRRNVVEPGH